MKKMILFFAITLCGSFAKSQTNKSDTTQLAVIEFVGDANVQKSLTSGDAIPVNTGIGVIYREVLDKKYKRLYSIEIGMFVNIASTVDTLKASYDKNNMIINASDFGNSILLPSNSGQSFGFNIRSYFTEKSTTSEDWSRSNPPVPLLGFISGCNISFSGSNRNWYDLSKSVKASTISLHVGLFHEFIKNDPELRKDYSITLGLGWTSRWIAGDISSKSNESIRKRILGSTETQFSGIEVSLGIRLKNIKVEVNIPFLSKSADVQGLSGTQPNTFIGFTGGFPLKLN